MAVADVTVAASEEAAATSPTDVAYGRVLQNPLFQQIALAPNLVLWAGNSAASLGKCGQGWIRTSEGVKPADLQSAPFGHFGTYPF